MTDFDRLPELRAWARQGQASEGWDFAHLGVRALDPLPWDYMAVARAALADATAVLDLGTGGGERFAELIKGASARCVATEEWNVNAPIAGRRLRPLGAETVRYWCEGMLPFRDGAFGLVLDRHEALTPDEVARVLAPGGRLVTQQCEHDNWREGLETFANAARFPDHGTAYSARFRELGFEVSLRRATQRVAYPSLGHLVYQIAAAPWTLPEFDIERDLSGWLALEARCFGPDGVVVTEGYYLLEARKPPGKG